jgi:anti-anti-sigma factor
MHEGTGEMAGGANVGGRARRVKQNGDKSQAKPAAAAAMTLHAARSGQWMEAEAMRRWALEQLERPPEATREIVVDLSGIEHLDASALQILLAIAAGQRGRDGALRLAHGSAGLRRWFEFAGAQELLGSGDDAAAATEESQACAKF